MCYHMDGLENILLSDGSQTLTVTGCGILLHAMYRTGESIVTAVRFEGVRDRRNRKEGCLKRKDFFLG